MSRIMLKTFLWTILVANVAIAQPAISVTPSTIAFGNIKVNATSTVSLQISNTGNSDLIITEFLLGGNHAGQFSLPGNPITPFVINANVTRIVDVRFSPNSIGSKSGLLQLISNDAFSDTLDVPLAGTGLASQIQLTPASIQFNNVVVGGRGIKTLQISNLGNDVLRIQDTSIVGTNSSNFRFVSPPVLPITILPGANPRIFQVEFAPTTGGANSAFLVLTSNDPQRPVSNIPLNGTGVFPDITVSTLALNYQNVVVGLDSTLSVAITNDGVGELIISDVDIVGQNQALFTFSAPVTTPIIIQPAGPAVTLNIDFKPDSTGSKEAFLIIASNDPNENPVSISLTGNGVKPVIAAVPPSANFGSVLVGADSIQSIAIQNLGDSPLTISDTVFAGQSISHFTVLSMPTLPFTIPVGGAQRLISIQFLPTTAGQKNASLRLVNNDVYRNPLIVSLVGTGVEPDIGSNPNSLAFGNVEVGQSFTRIVNIRNDGGATLVINDTAFAGANQSQFSFVNNLELPITILPGGNPVTMSLKFTPASAGAKTAALQLFSNDPDENPFSVNLTGTGISPIIVATPDSVAFGNVRVGNDSLFTLLLTNTGTADLRISDTTITGPQPGLFAIQNNPTLPLIIAPGSPGFPLLMRFTPQNLGAVAAELSLTSNDPLNPKYRVPLTGTGAYPDIDFLQDSVDFGNALVNGDTLVELPIYNRGGVALNLTDISVFGDKSAFSVDTTHSIPLSISANDSLILKLHFSPDSLGSFADSLQIVSDDPDEPVVKFVLSGYGVLPSIILIDSSLDFGPVKLLDDSVGTIRLSNNGTATLVISDFFVTGLNQGQFSLADTSALPVFVPVGNDTSVLTVRFTPAFRGQKIATLNLVHNDLDDSPSQLALTGRGVNGPSIDPLTFSTVTLNQPVQVEATVTSDTTLQSVLLQYGAANQAGFANSIVMTAGADLVYRAVIDGAQVTTSGLKTRITATDNFPVKSRRASYLSVNVPENAVTHTFPDRELNRWQMFSIPFMALNPINANITTMLSDLGQEDEFTWKIYRTDSSGDNSNYLDLDQLQAAGDFGRFRPGNAFWLYLRSDNNGGIPTRSLTFPAMETVSPDSFLYILQPGWNQIANPYNFAINWSQIAASGKDSLQAYRWDGSAWSQALNKAGWTPLVQNDFVMEPWKGIVVRNNLDTAVNLVFYPSSQIAGKTAKPHMGANNWHLALAVEGDQNFDVSVVGMDNLAEENADFLDYRHPGKIDPRMVRGFLSQNVEDSRAFSSNFLPSSPEGGIWYYTVESAKPRIILRDLYRESLPPQFGVWVYDSKYRKLQSLTAGQQIILDDIRENEVNRFVIVVGTETYLEQNIGNVVHIQPAGFELQQNFPNPFNPVTRIRFQVPEDQLVQIEIYDVLGRKIRTLVDGFKAAGFYEVMWNGRNESGFETASGIYFYRIKSASSGVLTRRMLKLK